MTLRPDSLFNRRALQEYILIAGQHPAGGLRDKPPKQARVPSFLFTCAHVLYAGTRTPTILLTAYLAYRPHSTACALHLRGEKRCVRRGKAKMASALPRLPRLSVGKRKTVALTLSVRLRTVSYVVYLLVSTASLLRKLQNATHPLFNLTVTHTEGIMAHFYKQSVPKRVPKRPQ